jgi:hypothetical protein
VKLFHWNAGIILQGVELKDLSLMHTEILQPFPPMRPILMIAIHIPAVLQPASEKHANAYPIQYGFILDGHSKALEPNPHL